MWNGGEYSKGSIASQLTQVESAVDWKVWVDIVLIVADNQFCIVHLVQRFACHRDVSVSETVLGCCTAGLYLVAATIDIAKGKGGGLMIGITTSYSEKWYTPTVWSDCPSEMKNCMEKPGNICCAEESGILVSRNCWKTCPQQQGYSNHSLLEVYWSGSVFQWENREDYCYIRWCKPRELLQERAWSRRPCQKTAYYVGPLVMRRGATTQQGENML